MGLFEKLRGWGGPARTNASAVESEPEQAHTYLTGTGRAYDDLEHHDTPVKVHISEPIRIALHELGDYYNSNLSTVLRHILFVHLYGSYDLHARGERGNNDFMPYKSRADDVCGIRYSISPGATLPPPPDLGKNLDNIKIWLPAKMVGDIDALANDSGVTRSVYIREAVIRHLFGRIQLPNSQREKRR